MVLVHVVIVGCGRVGSGLAVRLVEQGHTVAIIDKLAKAFRRLPPDWPGTVIEGSGFDRARLDQAGAAGAGALAAVTSGDNSNILTARIARENYGISNVVARIYDPRRAEIYQRLGIPTVATVTWTIDQVMRRMLPAARLGEWTDASGRLLLMERVLPDAWAGKSLRDLGGRAEVNIVAVTRGGTPRLDVTNLVGQEGDLLHLAVLKEDVEELERLLDGRPALADERDRSGTVDADRGAQP